MRQVRVFLRLVALDVTLTVQYRGGFLVMQIRNMVTPIVSLLVWQAAAAAGADLPVSGGYLATYFIFVSVVSMLTSSWTAYFLAASIRLGDLARWLVRPASTHLSGAANNVGEKIVKLVLIAPLIAVFALVLRDRMQLPHSLLTWLLFGISLLMAAAMVFALDVMVGSLAFWFDDVNGFSWARRLVVSVLSGAVIPLALMPGWAGGVVAVQPFRFTVSYPLEVLLGTVSGSLAAGFALQTGWTVAFIAAAALVWRRGLRNYQAAGA
jgi:ABC-2 type transport system permease protein